MWSVFHILVIEFEDYFVSSQMFQPTKSSSRLWECFSAEILLSEDNAPVMHVQIFQYIYLTDFWGTFEKANSGSEEHWTLFPGLDVACMELPCAHEFCLRRQLFLNFYSGLQWTKENIQLEANVVWKTARNYAPRDCCLHGVRLFYSIFLLTM